MKNCGCYFFLFFSLTLLGCFPPEEKSSGQGSELIQLWGNRGINLGQFSKPRALVYDSLHHLLYVVDLTARIQQFNAKGHVLFSFTTPESQLGKPTGLDVTPEGNILVADTHYHRVLCYTPQGKLLWKFGEYGTAIHQFVYVTDVTMDSQGYVYVTQYGDALGKYDRVQKFTTEGKFILAWGERGIEPGQFERPMALAVEKEGNILVADACNHRIQRFSNEGKLLGCWGTPGIHVGELAYPYGIALDKDGNIYVSEFGNNRIQKFTAQGKSLGIFGVAGQSKGMFANPWDISIGEEEYIYVADALNHRVQKIHPKIFD